MSSSTSNNSDTRKQPYLNLESLRRNWHAGTKPSPQVNVVEWAEQFRKLSKESSNGGRFITSRVEVARGPMLVATEPGVSKITLMACTQLLKTTVIENILGRFIHVDPCPILVVQPKDDAAETFSKDRLAPMIRDTKVLRDLFGDAKAKDAGATLTHKQFPGGHITLVGSNSPTNLAMRPIRLLTCDEIDKYPLSAGGEGPPIDLAEERQAEFSTNGLTVLACSPTVAGRSAIEASYEESDQRKAFVECPHCQTWPASSQRSSLGIAVASTIACRIVGEYTYVPSQDGNSAAILADISKLKAEVLRVAQLAEGISTLDAVYAKTFSDEFLRVLIGFRKDGTVDIAEGYSTLDPVWKYVRTYSDETTVMYGIRRDGTFYPSGSSAVADLPIWINKGGEVSVNKAGRRADLTFSTPATMTNFSASATSDLATYSQDTGSAVQTVTEDLTCLTSLLPSILALYHDILYGQSLANGTNSGPASYTSLISPGRAVMFNSGYKPHGVSAAIPIPNANILSLVDARETGADDQSPAAGISFGMVQPGRLASTEASLVSVHARGGQTYEVLKKNGSDGGTEYNNLIRSMKRAKVIAGINGLPYLKPAVHWIQGENNIGDSLAKYSSNLIELQGDISFDIGQQIVLITDQTSSFTGYNLTTSEVMLAQLAVALANPLTHACVGPKYFLTYSDLVHLIASNYVILGAYHARTRDRMRKGLDARPMHVTNQVRVAADAFEQDWYVPAGELTIDTTAVTDPGNYGVTWTQIGGTARTISSVTKIGPAKTRVTLSGDPGSFAPTSHIGIALYGVAGNAAGPTTGARACFRDQSTDLDPYGNPMRNWACHQKLLVTA